MRGNKFFKFIDKYIGFALLVFLKILNIIPFQKFFSRDKDSFLIVKLSALGDTILLLPVIKKIKTEKPRCKITMVVTDVNKAIVDGCEYIDDVVVLDIKRIKNPFYFIAFLQQLFKRKPYIAMDFDQWLRISPLICFFSGAMERIGFKTKGQHRHYLYTRVVNHSENMHELDCFFLILKKAGYKIKTADKKLFFDIEPVFKKQARKKIKDMKIR